MLSACIYAATHSKWSKPKYQIIIADVLVTLFGFVASIMSYLRIEAFIVHQMLTVLDIFLFINLLSVTLYYFHEEVCLYVFLFDAVLFIINFIYQMIILFSKTPTGQGGVPYTLLSFGYPLYMIGCFIIFWHILTHTKPIH